MSTITLTGKDVVKINGRILNDFAEGDVAALTFPNDMVTIKTGKNGNSIYAFKNDGRQVDFALRVLVGSSDDKFLNNLAALMKNDPAAFVLIAGEFVKNAGNGAGAITAVTYILAGGVISKGVEATDNADGTTDQAVAVYHMKFSNGDRSIG